MLISDSQYIAWQKKLAENKLFRTFWKFCGIYSVLIIFFVSVYLIFLSHSKEVFLAFCAFVLARLIISPLIYFFYKKDRPYQVLKFTPLHSWLFSEPTTRSNSFPSDHAASFAAISAVIFWYFPAIGFCLLSLSLLNGAGRVVLGYHYISHIIAGWAVGLISAWAVIFLLSKLVFT